MVTDLKSYFFKLNVIHPNLLEFKFQYHILMGHSPNEIKEIFSQWVLITEKFMGSKLSEEDIVTTIEEYVDANIQQYISPLSH